jgi:hypothetical protein
MRLSVLLPLLSGALAAQTLTVTSAAPAGNAVAVTAAARIVVTFSAPLDGASISASSVKVFGRWSGAVPGDVTFAGNQLTFAPRRPYFAGEMVSVALPRTVRGTNGGTLVGGHAFGFWAKSAPGNRTFNLANTIPLRRQGEGFIATYGVLAADLDGEGSPDIIAANEVAHDYRVLRNDGCGNFAGPMVVYPIPNNQEPSPTESADFNGDGLLDMVSGNSGGAAITINLNNGNGGFLPAVNYATGGFTHGVCVLDADGDGDADVAAPNSNQMALFLNNGNGTLAAPVFFDPQGSGEDNIAAVDANNDGKTDLYVGNLGSSDVSVLLGNGQGTFTFASRRNCGGAPFQMAAGDVNGDGIVDAVTANRGTNSVGILLGNGTGGFAPAVTYSIGSQPAAVDLGDLDGDGDLDIAASNYGSADYTLWFNNGNGTFAGRQTLASSRAGSCCTLVDFNRDGVLDVLATDELVDEVRLYAHASAGHAGSQPRSCGAALRVNSLGARAGYATPAQSILGDRDLFVGASGAPSALYATFLGLPLVAGAPLPPFGTLNLDPAQALVTLASGTLDLAGEVNLRIGVPALAPGSTFAVQAVVVPGVATLTNPEAVIVQ